MVFLVHGFDNQAFASQPSNRDVVVGKRSIRLVPHLLRRRFNPIRVVLAQAANCLGRPISIMVPAVNLVTAMRIYVVFKTRITATSPAFVARASVLRAPEFFASILFTWLNRQSILNHRVLRPLHNFLRHSTACVRKGMKLALRFLTRIGRFVHARAIIFRHATPVVVRRAQAVFFQPSAIRPIVFVNGTATQPAGRESFRLSRNVRRVVTVAIHVNCQ